MCQIFEGFNFGFEKFGLGKKVSVSVSENLVSEKKVSVSFSEKLVSEKSFGFGKIGLKKVSILVSEKLVSEKENQKNKKERRPSKQC